LSFLEGAKLMSLIPYVGNPLGPGGAGFVGTVMTPDDGDAWTAAELNPAYQLEMDDLAFLNANMLASSSVAFAATTTWTVPPNCNWILVEMCGGGGGGEGGCRGLSGSITTQYLYAQGGGGAGAPRILKLIAVTPGQVLTITIGAGGTAGAAGGGAGGDGGSTIIGVQGVIGYLAVALGGKGCGYGQENYAAGSLNIPAIAEVNPAAYTDVLCVVAPGAVGVADSAARPIPYGLGPNVAQIVVATVTTVIAHQLDDIPQRGGSCVGGGSSSSNSLSTNGGGLSCYDVGGSPSPVNGGSRGARGTTGGGAYFGGLGGGGGGAGAFGSGGNGGAGGAGNDSGAGSVGGTGATPNANTGAGGGGGGCGGNGSTSGGTGGPAGAGGSGFCRFFLLSALGPG
jgi:hypothetical protein